jgi:hypothetical protein
MNYHESKNGIMTSIKILKHYNYTSVQNAISAKDFSASRQMCYNLETQPKMKGSWNNIIFGLNGS